MSSEKELWESIKAAGDQMKSETSGYMQVAPNQNPHPCPTCGHCPTCGRGGYYTQPPYWWYQPYINPGPGWPYITWTSGTAGNK